MQQKTEFACPTCGEQITAGPSGIICSANPSHRWNDTIEFYATNPQMKFKIEPPKALPQEHHEPFALSLPIGVKDAFIAKFGEKAGVTIASVLMQMIEGNMMIIGQTDLDRLAKGEVLGKTPQNASELVGMVYSLRLDVDNEKAIAASATQDLKAYEGMSRGSVVVNLGDQYQNAVDKARGAEVPLKVFIERAVIQFLADNWI
jgi:hypothetical protein